MKQEATAAEALLSPDHPLVAGRTGRGVGIAVIDSGVNLGHPHVGRLASGIAFDESGRPHGDVVDRLGHGTAVAAAIHEKAPDAEIHIARVFHDALATSVEALLAAMDWALARGVRLINLSLGTANPESGPPLLEAVECARRAGAIVVSAREGAGRTWYPGSLPGAIGVLLDESCPRDSLRLTPSAEGVVVRASGYPRPIPGLPPQRNLQGVSFAVANATGLLASVLQDRRDLERLETLLDLPTH
ncbi:MAG TPA: S8 family serine peptidase [Longimicrobiaceae bacterium]|nr:S8 family serine peptidase [Longimicrobiaceae bacterium]